MVALERDNTAGAEVSGQTISGCDNIGESPTGVQVQMLNGSTLILSGANSYAGGRGTRYQHGGKCNHR